MRLVRPPFFNSSISVKLTTPEVLPLYSSSWIWCCITKECLDQAIIGRQRAKLHLLQSFNIPFTCSHYSSEWGGPFFRVYSRASCEEDEDETLERKNNDTIRLPCSYAKLGVVELLQLKHHFGNQRLNTHLFLDLNQKVKEMLQLC